MRARVLQGCGALCLFTTAEMSDCTRPIPPRRRTGLCSMLMNIHLLNGPAHSPVSFPLPPCFPHPHLAPRCRVLDTSTRKHAGFLAASAQRGTISFNRWKKFSRSKHQGSITKMSRRDQRNPITPAVSTDMVGCISRCLH